MQRFELTHIHGVDVLRIVDNIAISRPVDALEVVEQLVPGHDVDALVGVARFYLVELGDANLVLDGPLGLHHALGFLIAMAHHLQEVLVEFLDGAYHHLLLLAGVVVVFFRERGSAMSGAHHILIGVERIHRQINAEWSRAKSLGVEVIHHLEHLVVGLDRTHLLEVGQNGLITHLVAAHGVHVQAIQAANLLAIGALRQLLAGILHDEVVDAVVVLFIEVHEGAVLGVLLVERVSFEPSAHGILPEVVTRFHTQVHIGLVHMLLGLCRACHACKCEGSGENQFFHCCL